MKLQNNDECLRQALCEDLQSGDITAAAVSYEQPDCSARIIAKQAGVVAGIEVAARVFALHDGELQVAARVKDGDPVENRTVLLEIHGNGRSILEAERVALNFLGRMSGIATMTRRFVEATKPHQAKILDTRKTAPLLRTFDKYAVACGGGNNHRFGLFDMILIKENHIRFAGGIEKALAGAAAYRERTLPAVKIEIEVTTLDELQRAAQHRPDRIMLDNFSLDDMRAAVEIIDGKIELEASGNMTLDRIPAVAGTGVDFISVGALTHSVTAFDASLLFQEN